jgi:hypothetical protein
VDPASPELRTQVQPLNPPADDAPPEIRTAATVASTDAFHLAALVGAGLLIMGAAVNWVGLGGRPEAEAERPGAAEPAVPAG